MIDLKKRTTGTLATRSHSKLGVKIQEGNKRSPHRSQGPNSPPGKSQMASSRENGLKVTSGWDQGPGLTSASALIARCGDDRRGKLGAFDGWRRVRLLYANLTKMSHTPRRTPRENPYRFYCLGERLFLSWKQCRGFR